MRRWRPTRPAIISLATICVLVIVGGILVLLAPRSHRPPSLPSAAPSVAPAATASPQASPGVVPVSRSEPTELIVSSLGIDSKLIQNEIKCTVASPDGDPACAAAGALSTPPLTGSDARAVGWYTGGSAPGQVGPAVLVAHVNSAALGNLTFWNLSTIHVGALIEVKNAAGDKLWFAVTATQQVDKTAFPTLAVYGATKDPELRLITCGGGFDSGTGHYLQNFVAYATEVPAPTE
jgi:hypothetical protein